MIAQAKAMAPTVIRVLVRERLKFLRAKETIRTVHPQE
jgi:hypothetical protein